MAETRKHKNVDMVYVPRVDSPYYKVVDAEGTLREYNTRDWDMKVTFTRKAQPFPDGSLVLDTSDNTLFHKMQECWYFLYLNDSTDAWTKYDVVESAMRVRSDRYKVLHEPNNTTMQSHG